MTEPQRQAVKEKIISEIERITKDISGLEEVTKPVGAEDMDEITRMDSIVNKSVNEAALASLRSRLAGLEYSLKRINEADFGYCLECGDEIPAPRLMAMPETVFCIKCAN